MLVPTQRYYASVENSEPMVVELETRPGGGFVLITGDRRFDVDAVTLQHGAVSMIINGESYGVEFEDHGDEVFVLVRGQVVRVDVVDERRRRLRLARVGLTAEGRQIVSAPMPGKIVKVLVNLGDEVRAGQGLVVVEAMKMENELQSPKAGKVVELAAKEGAVVEMNAKLVVVE